MDKIFTVTLALAASACLSLAQFSPSPLNPFIVGHNPTGIVSADFNHDLIPDLAVANQTDNNITILLGDGKGNFTAPLTGPTMNGLFPVGLNPSAIATGDFNNDGKPDLAVANINDKMVNVSILLGDGAGGFTSPPGPSAIPPITGKGPTAIAVADFDGDGNADVATANLQDGTVTILFGDGKGGFLRSMTLTTGVNPIAIVAADLNADGIPDLAVACEGDGKVYVFIDPGGKKPLPVFTLTSAAVSIVQPLTQSLSAIAAGNFTGHSTASGAPYLDLVVTFYSNTTFQGNLVLFTADEKGMYNFPSTYFPKSFGLQPVAIAAGTFTGGVNVGVAIANYRSGTLAVYAGDGIGDFSASKISPYTTGALPRAIAVADFNGDGLPDVAVANYNDGTVTVLLNTFSTAPTLLSAASDTAPVAPGSLVSIYGTGLAPTSNPNSTSVSLTDASGTVLPVVLLYSSPTQLNAQVPVQAAIGAGTFTVTVPSESPQKGTLTISTVAPALFAANSTGKGPALGYVQSLVTDEAPIPVFSCTPRLVCIPYPFDVSTGTTSLVLYATGIRNRSQLSAVTVTVGGLPLPPFYAGPAPGFFGVDQLNVALPASLAHSGTVFVQVTIGAAMSNPVTVTIE